MGQIEYLRATEEHLSYCGTISDCIADAARNSSSGLALRSPGYLAEKISAGNGIIALDGEIFVGFCYIQPWERNHFVAHSGLIVNPDYRGCGVATTLKREAFELTREKYPDATVFGLTTSPAVREINASLGYRVVPYSEITADLNFWKGCCSCIHYETLCKNHFENCLCTAMIKSPTDMPTDSHTHGCA